jgi:hypothetical protein
MAARSVQRSLITFNIPAPFCSAFPRLQRFARCVATFGMLGCILYSWSGELNTPQVKARYIHNFLKYITWPETNLASQVFAIAIVEAGPVKEALDEVVRTKKWNGKPIDVRSALSAEVTGEPQIVYISEADRDRIPEILKDIPKSTLTIGEGPAFLSKGGMIEFNLADGKVRFSVNLDVLVLKWIPNCSRSPKRFVENEEAFCYVSSQIDPPETAVGDHWE